MGGDHDRGGAGGHAVRLVSALLRATPLMSALAMHFSTTWHPSDAADPALPPEYPPLYPMLVGRVAA